MASCSFQRRGYLDIEASVLMSVKCGRKNKRSYTNTSAGIFKRHMNDSREFGLIRENGHGPEITERGERYLVLYGEIKALSS